MVPTHIYLSGFMSYREPAELDFNQDGLWVLEGPNGVGKSTIFDAITFVLFGEHRGGKQNHADLINHASDSLEVRLTLRLEDQGYRLQRCVPRKGRPTWQISEQAPDGVFKPVAGTEQREAYNAWVAEHLGLDYDAFTTSVLLLQGESEKLISQKPEGRRKLLAQLIDLSRYERLHELAKKEDEHRRETERIERQRGALGELQKEDLDAAEAALAAAVQERERLDRAVEELGGHLLQAEGRERLLKDQRELTRGLAAQQELLARTQEIHGAMAELSGLEPVLQPLRDAAAAQAAAGQAEGEASERERQVVAVQGAEAAAGQAEQEARQREEELGHREEELGQREEALRGERDRLMPIRDGWNAAEELRGRIAHRAAQIQALPLVADEGAAREELAAARREIDTAKEAAAHAQAEQKLVATRLREFEELIGAMGGSDGEVLTCDRCGQEITARHAQEERARLLAEREQKASALAQADRARRAAEPAVERAERALEEALRVGAQRHALAREQAGDEGRLSQRLEDLPPEAAQAGARLSALDPVLRALREERVAGLKALRGAREAAAQAAARVKKTEGERRRLELELQQVRDRRQQALGKLAALREQLPGPLREARPEQVMETERRLAALRPYRELAARLREAETDPAGRRLLEITRRLDEIPEAARRPAAELKQALAAGRAARQEAQDLRDTRAAELERLRQGLQQRAELDRRYKGAAREQALYGMLANLLGPEQLQRRLVRDAEQAIVQLANQELTGLTQGRIRLALRPGKDARDGKDGDEGAQKALDLLVYNQETGEQPTALALASGSQKFRIAISLALSIGRYLARETRRVESVIIDEGFGCLDRASREEAVEVLKELGGHLSRVILVSHQEEFSGRFSNGYRIDLVDRTSVPTRVNR